MPTSWEASQFFDFRWKTVKFRFGPYFKACVSETRQCKHGVHNFPGAPPPPAPTPTWQKKGYISVLTLLIGRQRQYFCFTLKSYLVALRIALKKVRECNLGALFGGPPPTLCPNPSLLPVVARGHFSAARGPFLAALQGAFLVPFWLQGTQAVCRNSICALAEIPKRCLSISDPRIWRLLPILKIPCARCKAGACYLSARASAPYRCPHPSDTANPPDPRPVQNESGGPVIKFCAPPLAVM